MINGSRFLGGLPIPNIGKAPESFGAQIFKSAAAEAAKDALHIPPAPLRPKRETDAEFFTTMAHLLDPKNIKSEKASYMKILSADDFTPEAVSKTFRDIMDLNKQNPKEAVKSFLGYVHDIVAQTCTDFWNTFYLREVHPTAKELKEVGIIPRFKAKGERHSATINAYTTKENPKAQSKISFLNGTMLNKDGKAIGEERILAEALVAPDGKIRSMYNAVTNDGSSVTVDFTNQSNAVIKSFDPAHKQVHALKLEDGALSFTDLTAKAQPKTKLGKGAPKPTRRERKEAKNAGL